MSAEKFFEKYSIEEISKKTKISPISLRFIRNKEFEKLPRAKFFGFLNIIEKEFKVDLSDLKEEYEHFNPQKQEEIKEQQSVQIEKEKKNYLLFVLALILLLIGGYILYKTLHKTSSNNEANTTIKQNFSTPKTNQNNIILKNENNNSISATNITDTNKTIINNITKKENNVTNNLTQNKQLSLTKIKNETNNTAMKYKIIIIPHKLLWFKAINIDTNKTIQFLTSKEKILPKGNYYIKLGHGEETINYNNQTITPNTKKIVRILFKNGKYKFMKKPNRYEK